MFKTLVGVLDPKKNPSDKEIQKISPFIFCRWLSGSPHAIQAANMINQFSDIPIENQYKMIKAAFAGKIKYIPYPKKETVEDEKTLEYLCEHFKISMEKAKDYLNYISDEELNEIISIYSSRK